MADAEHWKDLQKILKKVPDHSHYMTDTEGEVFGLLELGSSYTGLTDFLDQRGVEGVDQFKEMATSLEKAAQAYTTTEQNNTDLAGSQDTGA
ncbi:hypothetical protein CGZ91_05120 [Parenemella sanctibonifatiensis]|uniref:Uncharacterized protein n=2 Tax=Parenemella sanctibonifatiensis TaxID=2016505 RepID=A0A255EN36_9ACTN|nr:hypothetical protein CGZ91_05120 [Parenemella sanctibonifatiensis]